MFPQTNAPASHGRMMIRRDCKLKLQQESGNALLLVLILIVTMAAFTAAMFTVALSHRRDVRSRTDDVRALYNAVTAVNVAMVEIRFADQSVEGFDLDDVSVGAPRHEYTSGGEGGYRVQRTQQGDLTVLLATGVHNLESRRIEAILLTRPFQLGSLGAVSVAINPETRVYGDVPAQFNGIPAYVTGQDHDAEGGLLKDQSGAVPSLSLNDLPGFTDWNVVANSGAKPLRGPDPTNDANYMGPELDRLTRHAQKNSDVLITTPTVLDGDQTIGGPDDYKVVFVNGAAGGSIKLSGRFNGYGLLVVRVNSFRQIDSTNTPIWLSGQAQWHGLILLSVMGDYAVDADAPIALTGGGKPERSPHVLGGVITYIAGENVSWSGSGGAIRLTGNSTTRYSRDAISAALEAATPRYELVSYRFLD